MITAASAHKSIVPCDGANATLMATKCLQESVFGGVPDLEVASMGANCEKGSIAAPLYTSYTVLRADIRELGHFAIRSRPQVNA